jgi:phenolic acid decarboxylase
VVYYQYGTTWAYKIFTRGEHSLDLPLHTQDKTGPLVLNKILVTAVDRLGNESEQVAAQLN